MEEKKEQEVVNKLFLIGNGFDLALGLKTSYRDFMLWLLIKFVDEANKNKNDLLPSEQNYKYLKNRLRDKEKKIIGYSRNILFLVGTTEEINIDELKFDCTQDEFIKVSTKKTLLENYINEEKIIIMPTPNRKLFSSIYKTFFLSWVDIEEIYYKHLKGLFKLYKNPNIDHKDVLENIKKLNADLDFISYQLKEYLKTQKLDYHSDFFPINEQFKKTIYEKHESFTNQEFKVEKYYFLNFNYTSSIFNVLKKDIFTEENTVVNHIHGKDEAEIIFGYGDEMDKDYKELESTNENSFLKHIKSFNYMKYPEYRKLLGFLSSGKFQVCVYGHSCGLSDRVMLNEIFEHDNCHSIRIFYYNNIEDYVQKTMNISRHFNSNQLMRQRIINFNERDMIPQID